MFHPAGDSRPNNRKAIAMTVKNDRQVDARLTSRLGRVAYGMHGSSSGRWFHLGPEGEFDEAETEARMTELFDSLEPHELETFLVNVCGMPIESLPLPACGVMRHANVWREQIGHIVLAKAVEDAMGGEA